MADVDAATVRSDARQWRGLLVTGAWCAFASVAMVVVQIGIYVVWPPPESTAGFFELLLDNPVRGGIAPLARSSVGSPAGPSSVP